MEMVKELLLDQMQDLLHAENQLVKALPNMAKAAHHPKVKAAFEKHLAQTRTHVERLEQAFELMGEKARTKTCKAMAGLVAEGEETIEEGEEMENLAADLALIAAAQRVEHYEIAAYGTAQTLARQMGAVECARLLSRTLGEEESTDFLLTSISCPLLQQAALDDQGASVDLGVEGKTPGAKDKKKAPRTERGAA